MHKYHLRALTGQNKKIFHSHKKKKKNSFGKSLIRNLNDRIILYVLVHGNKLIRVSVCAQTLTFLEKILMYHDL